MYECITIVPVSVLSVNNSPKIDCSELLRSVSLESGRRGQSGLPLGSLSCIPAFLRSRAAA